MHTSDRRNESNWGGDRGASTSTAINELTFAHQGRKYHCRKAWVPTFNGGSATDFNSHWVVEIESVPFLAFDAADGETEDLLRRRVILWDARGRIPDRSGST